MCVPGISKGKPPNIVSPACGWRDQGGALGSAIVDNRGKLRAMIRNQESKNEGWHPDATKSSTCTCGPTQILQGNATQR